MLIVEMSMMCLPSNSIKNTDFKPFCLIGVLKTKKSPRGLTLINRKTSMTASKEKRDATSIIRIAAGRFVLIIESALIQPLQRNRLG